MDASIDGEAILGLAGGGGFSREGDGSSDTNFKLFGVGHSWTVSPMFSSDANFGFTDLGQKIVPSDFSLGNFGRNQLGIQGTNSTDDSCSVEGVNRCAGIPAFHVPGYSSFGQTDSWNPLFRADYSLNFSQNFSWVRGSHEFRWGYNLVRHHLDHWQPEAGSGPRGSFGFAREMTSVPGAPISDQNAWATFLLGYQSEMGKTLQWEPMTSNEWQHALYFRDRWQVTPQLTLALGLRWEYYPLISRDDRALEYLDLDTFQVVLDNSIDVSESLIAPRVGLAYRVTPEDVLRGGFGINYDPLPFASTLRGFYPLMVARSWKAPDPFVPFSALEEGIPVFKGPNLDDEAVDLPSNVVQRTMPPDAISRGYIQSWNLTYERRLPSDLVASLAYVGTRTVDQLADRDINWSPPGGGVEGRKFYPLSTVPILLWDGWLRSDYNALQLAVNRRFRDGLFVRAAYTYSKATNMTDDDGWAGLLWNDPELFDRNRAEAGYNRPHMLQLATIYEIPLGREGGGLTNWLIRNWQLSGIFSVTSNTPFTVVGSDAILNAPGNIQTADQVGDVTKLGGIGAGNPYYEPSAFAAVERVPGVDCTGFECYGNTGRNILRGPTAANLDFSVLRKFVLTRGLNLEFRSEFFNLTNTPHFNNPHNDVTSSSFMQITSTDPDAPNRIIRFGLKMNW
jgi:hypothetical protein